MLLWNITFDMLLSKFTKGRVRCIGFADDGTLIISGKDLPKMRKLLQKAIDKVHKWATECGLTLSPTKTNALLITHKRKIPEIDLSLHVGGNPIAFTEHTKCLGVTIDNRLSWNPHINAKIKQAKLYLHQMRSSISRVWGPTPEKMLWIWTAVVRPAISYASYIWSTNLTETQKNKLNKIQRMALMQLGNFRPSTPESGLDVIMGQLPLDLHLLACSIKTHIRLNTKPIGWLGKGPGQKGKVGHIMRMEALTTDNGIPTVWKDQLPNEKIWEKHYTISEDFEGFNLNDGFRLYTDGSKLNNNSGYGAVLYDPMDRNIGELKGTCGPNATVFQAECHAILEGISLITPDITSITILTDNQGVVKALDNTLTNSSTIKNLKQALNKIGKHTHTTIQWIKAHVGHAGNERADELAKQGTEIVPCGPEPNVALSKSYLNSLIHKHVMGLWEDRWSHKKDARQTSIFFEKIDLNKSKELVALPKDQLSITVRAITGHDFRRRHNALVNSEGENQCRLCLEAEETPSHIILECPSLTHLRASTFKSYLADIRHNWKAKSLAHFLSAPSIADLETDLSRETLP